MEPNHEAVDLFFAEPTLLTGINGEIMTRADCMAAVEKSQPPLVDQRIMRALEAIDQALDDKIKQATIIRAAGMSKSNFTKTFRANIGMPLRRYVLWQRLKRAVLTIQDGSDATHAAHKAGFSDSAHFSRTMRETFGVTPTQSLFKIKMTPASRHLISSDHMF